MTGAVVLKHDCLGFLSPFWNRIPACICKRDRTAGEREGGGGKLQRLFGLGGQRRAAGGGAAASVAAQPHVGTVRHPLAVGGAQTVSFRLPLGPSSASSYHQ